VAHSAIHFAVGMAVGSAVAARPLARAWFSGGAIAGRLAQWLALSYALGLYAVVPALLRRAGVPAWVCEGWWMNVFLLHPLITALMAGGSVVGPTVLGMSIASQYTVLLVALRRCCRGTTTG